MRSMRPIRYNCKIWKDVPLERGYFIGDIRELLNKNLKLSDYGKGLSWFQVFAVIDPRDFHESFFYHNKHQNGMTIQLHLDYEAVMKASDAEYEQIAALGYLQAIDELSKYLVTQFDLQRYRQDVENLFRQQGWLIKAAA